MLAREDADTDTLVGRPGARRAAGLPSAARLNPRPARKDLPASDLSDLIGELTEQMHVAAAELQFEMAARLRDEIADLKKELRGMVEATR